jgi:hypothetical protein
VSRQRQAPECLTVELTQRVYVRNLVELEDRGEEEAHSGMAVKISLERYRMFFVPGEWENPDCL